MKHGLRRGIGRWVERRRGYARCPQCGTNMRDVVVVRAYAAGVGRGRIERRIVGHECVDCRIRLRKER